MSNKLHQKSEVSIYSQEEHDLHEWLHQYQHTEDLQSKEDVSVLVSYYISMLIVLVVDDRDIMLKGWHSQHEMKSNEDESQEIKHVPDFIQVLITLIFHLLELKIKEVAGGNHLDAIANNNSHPISCQKLDEEGSHDCGNVQKHQRKEVGVWYLKLLINDVSNGWLVLNVASCFFDNLAHQICNVEIIHGNFDLSLLVLNVSEFLMPDKISEFNIVMSNLEVGWDNILSIDDQVLYQVVNAHNWVKTIEVFGL